MTDLGPLIRLHKYQLDEKRRVLTELHSELGLLERAREKMEAEFDLEKKAVDESGDIHFTFPRYLEAIRKKREVFAQQENALVKKIELAKEEMMETFSELKKYEMTQAERDRLEEEAQRIKEGRMMDEIGLESFRRKQSD